MASIYYNFELPDVSAKIKMRKSWNGQEASEDEVDMPWAKLFGSHECLARKGIFLIRHPMNTFYSHWVFCGRSPSFNAWLKEKNILHWKILAERAIKNTMLIIKYEDVVNDLQPTMKRIQDYYNLTPKHTSFEPVKKPVGWDANKSDGHQHQSKYDQEALNKVRQVLGDEIFGYLLK